MKICLYNASYHLDEKIEGMEKEVEWKWKKKKLSDFNDTMGFNLFDV